MAISYYFSNITDGNLRGTEQEDIYQNRLTLIQKLGIQNTKLIYMDQVHSNNITYVDNKSIKLFSGFYKIPDSDAIYTNNKGLVLVAQGADCPIGVVLDKQESLIAAFHSGWRSTLLNILPNLIDKFKDLGCLEQNLQVVIGPCAGVCCYEVKEDLIKLFSEAGFNDAIFPDQDKFFLDIKAVLLKQLELKGITNFSFEKDCTICNENFFSYRRQKEKAGRQLAMVWME